jgi:bacterioferritin-associated ferredoxin
LKELAVCLCSHVTDAGISTVISHCNQLRILNLWALPNITGMCALCEDPEPTLCFINLCVLSFGRFIADHKGPPLDHIVSWYNSAHISITFSLNLHCIACCSQIHPIIIIHIFKFWAVTRFVSLSQYHIFFLICHPAVIFPCKI